MAEVALLVDTDVLVDFFRGSPEAGQWLADHQSETIGIPVIVLMELLQEARSPAEQRAIREPLVRFWIEQLESGDSQQALDWFSSYRLSHGTGIMDCLIATAAARLKVPRQRPLD
jgi:predicted nucleic acid-binding protein